MKVGDLVKYVDSNFYGIILDCDDLEASIKDFEIKWMHNGDTDWRFENELELVCESG